MNDFNYRRRHSSTVQIGNVPLGGDNPIRIQSMTSTSTLDTDASVAQCRRIFDAGADYVRLTAQGVREAHNIGEIRAALHAAGYTKPLVADIHFNPKAAFEAAATTDKVRINPGNFVDAARTFKKLEYTDEEYAAELEKIRRAVVPFIAICREHHTAVRLGVNHGSLSDRIMSRYGDTPAGMVESAMEYLRIFREENFNDVAISIKASNTVIMVETVRRLVAEMDREDMHYPLHLGVTEAGDGEDGRIKSAVGIGTLLAEGIGDTVRVSLSEEPELEIPVARKLVDYITVREGHAPNQRMLRQGLQPHRSRTPPHKRRGKHRRAKRAGSSHRIESSRRGGNRDETRFLPLRRELESGRRLRQGRRLQRRRRSAPHKPPRQPRGRNRGIHPPSVGQRLQSPRRGAHEL